jgi:hypothetical protein
VFARTWRFESSLGHQHFKEPTPVFRPRYAAVLICSALVPVSVGFPVRRSTASRKWVSRKWEYRKVVFIRSIPLVRTLLQKWTEAFSSEVGYLCWSHEGEYIYFQDKGISAQNYHNRIVRFRRSDRKIPKHSGSQEGRAPDHRNDRGLVWTCSRRLTSICPLAARQKFMRSKWIGNKVSAPD